MNLGTNLQFIRRQRGMTQEDLAARLGVSRQSVSKWESDGALPELDKLLTLSELYNCTLDDLLQGDLEARAAVDSTGYDAHCNRFAAQITAGVAVLIGGLALVVLLDGLTSVAGLPTSVRLSEPLTCIALMLCVIAGVSLLILGSMEHDDFVRRHPYIEPFYPQATLDAFALRFRRLVVGGVALILTAVMLLMTLLPLAEARGSERGESLIAALFFALLAVAVGLLVWAGMQQSKYDIPAYNKDHDQSPEARALRVRIHRICSVIMLLAVVIFLVLGLWESLWGLAVLAFPVGGILCAIVSVLLGRQDDA